MKTCGIDLKGRDVILVSLSGEKEDYFQLEPETKKINLEDSKSQEAVRNLFTSLNDYIERNGIQQIAIKERATKGKFAGGPASFKMEGLIQLLRVPVEIVNGRTVQAKIKIGGLDFSGYNQYQIDALKLAYFLLEE